MGQKSVENQFYHFCLHSLWGGRRVILDHPSGRKLDSGTPRGLTRHVMVRTGVWDGNTGGLWAAKIGPKSVQNRFFQLCLELLWGCQGII